MKGWLYRCKAPLSVLLLVALCLGGFPVAMGVSAAPDGGGRVPYRFHFEQINRESGGGYGLRVFRDMELKQGDAMTVSGWLVTPEGVSSYQYLWVPVGGASAEWITVEDVNIFHRTDLAAAEIEFPSGHSTAGFHLSLTPPKDTPEGYYDVYLRALDGMGYPMDMAAILGLRYGQPDRVDTSGLTISLPRLLREGESSLVGGAAVEGEFLRLPPDARVRLGRLDLSGFEQLRVTYLFPDSPASQEGKTQLLGLKSTGQYSYGVGEESYNLTDDLAYAPLTQRSGTLILDLSSCQRESELWLTGHLGQELLISEIELVATGYATDRVAARIYLNGELTTAYFRGANRTVASGITDPTMGEVLRLEVSEETNDPFISFQAGDLLRDHDLLLSADEYRYLVFLYRAEPTNLSSHMYLYLCSGTITGATENCVQGTALERDGKWHYLLMDLSQRPNWEGIIHGWRFDYISGDSLPGDAVEFAMVQFFRTREAAVALAESDPREHTPYRTGDPVLVPDLCEERENGGVDFSLDPSDTYVISTPSDTTPEEDTPEEDTPEEDTSQEPVSPPTDTPPIEEGETPPSEKPRGRGCGSALWVSPFLWIAPTLWLVKKNSSHKSIKEKNHEA